LLLGARAGSVAASSMLAALLAVVVAVPVSIVLTGRQARGTPLGPDDPGVAAATARIRQVRLARWRVISTLAWTVVVLLLISAISILLQDLKFNTSVIAQLLLVGLFAALVGFAELVSRYKDDPLRLGGSPATRIYVSVNIAAGIAALALVKEFEVFSGSKHPAIYEALLASFGAIAFFRSSLFTARVGDTDVGIGPSTLLKSLLDASDLMLDRGQAGDRATDVGRIMRDIDFNRAKVSLPTLCLALVQGLTQEQQKLVAEQIAKLTDEPIMRPEDKSTILGVYLLRQVGASVLDSAVATLGSQIRRDPPPVNAAPVEPADPPE